MVVKRALLCVMLETFRDCSICLICLYQTSFISFSVQLAVIYSHNNPLADETSLILVSHNGGENKKDIFVGFL